MKKLRLGVDVGGTNTVFGAVDTNGKILVQSTISTKGHASAEDFVNEVYKNFIEHFSLEIRSAIEHIGVGAPSANYYTGNIEFAPNLEWEGVIPLANLFSQKFSLPTKISNDANAAAMGEMLYGSAKGMKDFIMVTLGTGVGSGFVANGQLIYGHDGFAGELGHVISVRDGRLCGCGRKGCLEIYTSATGIVKTAYEFLEERKDVSLLRHASPQKLSSRDIYDAAVEGDVLALAIFEFTGKILGQTLADAVTITSPEAIILFGGLARAGEFIFEPTKRYMEENLLKIFQNKVKLLPSKLPESDAAILGAAALK